MKVPTGPRAALAQIVNRDFLESERHLAQAWRGYRVGAHADIVEFERRMCRRLHHMGIPAFAAEVVRTPERQAELFAEGRTRAPPGRSAHEFGLACDIVHGVLAWNMSREAWAIFGHVGKEVAAQAGIPVVWGGGWNFYDPAHWEIEGWRERKSGFPFGLK